MRTAEQTKDMNVHICDKKSSFIVWLHSVVESTTVEAGAKLDNLLRIHIHYSTKIPSGNPQKTKVKHCGNKKRNLSLQTWSSIPAPTVSN